MAGRTPSTQRRWRLLVPVTFGVVLVAVPTVFTIFPGWAEWSVARRVGVMELWLVAAIVGVFLTVKADDDLHASVEQEQANRLLAERRASISDQFRSILVPGIGGLPDQYHLTVYGPSPDGRFLIPVFPPAIDLRDPAIFEAGTGATGHAWKSPDGVFVVKGPAVSSDKYGLTSAQRRRYKMFGTVAAAVIRGDDDHPIGVLTAIGRVEDGFFDAKTGVEVLRDLADGIAWLVPKAVQWMLPRADEVAR